MILRSNARHKSRSVNKDVEGTSNIDQMNGRKKASGETARSQVRETFTDYEQRSQQWDMSSLTTEAAIRKRVIGLTLERS